MYAEGMGNVQELARIRALFRKNRPYFSALGNEERQALVLLMLEGRNLSVGELAERTRLSRPTVSHHLKILKDAGMVSPRKHGNKTIYCVKPGQYLTALGELINEAKRLAHKEG